MESTLPLKVRQTMVADDAARGLGVDVDDVEVLRRRKIIFDDQGGDFGYIIGETKFDRTRHRKSQDPQILYLFGIGANNNVMFYGQCRPLDITLRPLTEEEAQQIPGFEPTNDTVGHGLPNF
ncbi:hypothetical protein FS837_002671 [Tulasnella sp. UAMH 9824]|nr:hypothetical protein FS837_002671 [Tulasnella sp. UAMH 9824]